jgi:D-alanyl-D-alanine carboxypeptidase
MRRIVQLVRGWALGGLAATAFAFSAGATWTVITLSDLEVVEPFSEPMAEAATSPSSVPLVAPTSTVPGAADVPPCAIADEPVQEDPATDWATIVVDTNRALPADYAPPDLVDVSAAGFTTSDQIRQIVVPDLDALRQAAEANGTPLVMVSAYRSYGYQQGLFNNYVEELGLEEAERTSARPGHSEHQLGTAVDLIGPDTPDLETDFAATPTGQWLAANASAYGFVISYPDVARERSCYAFEPWHLRYVGRDLAGQIQASGLTLREWLLTH